MNQKWSCALPSPSPHVNPADLADRVARALDAHEERAELRREVGRDVAEVAVLARHEDDDHREAARLRERSEEPALVAPDRVLVTETAVPAVGRVLPRAAAARPQAAGVDAPESHPRRERCLTR